MSRWQRQSSVCWCRFTSLRSDREQQPVFELQFLWRRRRWNANFKSNRSLLVQWLTQSSAEGNVRKQVLLFDFLSETPALSIIHERDQGINKENQSNKEKKHGFTPIINMTHWSVKCIYATPNKQDNVDSGSEVVLKTYLVHDCAALCEAYLTISEISVIDIDINSTCIWHSCPEVTLKTETFHRNKTCKWVHS